MHNGCLLLLAFVAVFQPIASYTERVDGRQQRCDYRTSLRDPGVYFHGTYRFTKPAVEDRRLSEREDIREVRRNEVRENSLRTTSPSDRRLVDDLVRNTLTRLSRDRIENEAVLRRDNRDARLGGNNRDERNEDTRRERFSRVHETYQARFSSRQTTGRLSEDGSHYQSRIDTRRFNEPRVSIESRRNSNVAEAQRVGERDVRIANYRARDEVANTPNERRFARERVQRMDMRRTVSRNQLARSAERGALDRRSRNREFSSSSLLSDRISQASSNENSRDDIRSLNREDLRTASTRRFNDERKNLRDISQIQRQTLSAERKNIRESATRRDRRELHERSSENRRDTQLLGRARSTESRRENRDTERNSRLTRVVRSVDDRVSQNDHDRSLESRRGERDIRSMERFRSLERSADNRRHSRSTERARVLEIRRDIRNIERESQPMKNNNRVAETRRDIRHVEKYSRIAPVQGETRDNNRDACAFDSDRSIGHRATKVTQERPSERNTRNFEREIRTQGIERTVNSQKEARERVAESRRDVNNRELRSINRARSQENPRDARNVEFQLYRTQHTAENRRAIRNIESRTFRTERSDESRREIRGIESRTFRTERAAESRREIRNIDSRALRTERTDESRPDIRNIASGVFTTKRAVENRRGVRNIENRAFRAERVADSRREIRDSERLSRSLNRISVSRRDNRDNERDTRIHERILESRRNIQNTERHSRTEDEPLIDNRRATRSLERDSRSFGRERSMENRLNTRMVARDSRRSMLEQLTEDRRERATENLRDIRKELRLLSTVEGRRVDSRAMNLVRSRDLTMERKNNRATERLSKRDILDSRQNILKRESRRDTRTSEREDMTKRYKDAESRNGFNTVFDTKRESQSMFQNPTQAEDETPIMNWQYLFYTLQGLYICGVLTQLMNERSVNKKTRTSWWTAPQRLIKVD